MIKEIKNQKWNFVEMPDNIPSRSGEDSTFDHFRSTPYRFIVREFIQNSMDAALDTEPNLPVKVFISTKTIDSVQYPELLGSLLERMIACSARCADNKNGKDPYKNKVEYLTQYRNKRIPCLAIEDFNTTGMELTQDKQSGFNAGVRQMGASHKKSGNAGGSHGLGKTVGFVASELNAVYYSTQTVDGKTYGEGVIRLCTHNINNVDYFPDAFYDSHEGKTPDTDTEIPEDFRRKSPGTSVYVLGITPTEEDFMEMRQEVLRSFWLAIYHKKLEVMIDGEYFAQSNLSEALRDYFPDKKFGEYDVPRTNKLVEIFNPRPYHFNCILGEDNIKGERLVYNADENIYRYLGKATLYLYKSESISTMTTDRIVCMRDKEMVIQFYHPKTRKGYYGVLVCDGSGSEILRKLENVTHDKWDRKEVREFGKTEKEEAKNVLEDIERFIFDSVSSAFPTNSEKEYRVPVLSKYIVSPGSRNNSSNGSSSGEPAQETNIFSPVSTIADGFQKRRVEAKKVGRVVIKRKRKPKRKINGLEIGTVKTITGPVEAPPYASRSSYASCTSYASASRTSYTTYTAYT